MTEVLLADHPKEKRPLNGAPLPRFAAEKMPYVQVPVSKQTRRRRNDFVHFDLVWKHNSRRLGPLITLGSAIVEEIEILKDLGYISCFVLCLPYAVLLLGKHGLVVSLLAAGILTYLEV